LLKIVQRIKSVNAIGSKEREQKMSARDKFKYSGKERKIDDIILKIRM